MWLSSAARERQLEGLFGRDCTESNALKKTFKSTKTISRFLEDTCIKTLECNFVNGVLFVISIYDS